MALASRPKLLLADEPTTALDVALRRQMLELLSDLQRQTGMAVLLITHDLHLVRRFADRVAVMQHGHIVEQGAVARGCSPTRSTPTRASCLIQPAAARCGRPPRRPITRARGAARAAARGLSHAVAGRARLVQKGRVRGRAKGHVQLLQGGTLAVVGESGSGKSTLAQAVLGLLPSRRDAGRGGQAWRRPATRNAPANQSVAQAVCRWCSETRSRRCRHA